ncbi:MAG: hypothetical protein LBS45_00055 [Synergistaceae bacterium]|jgi:hypothetical protein|nr:hypothetical protein [Synergistaceae bacterium]
MMNQNSDTFQKFQVGAVLNRTWVTLWKRPFAFMGLAFLTMIVPACINEFILSPLQTGGEETVTFASSSLALLGGAFNFLFMVFFQGAITYAVFQTFMGDRASVLQSFGRSLNRMGALIGIAFTQILILSAAIVIVAVLFALFAMIHIVVGVVFILVASLIILYFSSVFYAAWYVATSVCVVERLGPLASLKRSRELTYGCKKKIYGMLSLALVIFMIVMGVGMFVVSKIGLSWPIALIIRLILSIVPYAFVCVNTPVVYYSLRMTKEDLTDASLAAIFD